MNYELAKKLKDAGFTFRQNFPCEHTTLENICPCVYPTLSELIEACGDRFGGLTHVRYLESKKEQSTSIRRYWKAYEFVARWSEMKSTSCYGDGETPEEAVANLWLILNKKP